MDWSIRHLLNCSYSVLPLPTWHVTCRTLAASPGERRRLSHLLAAGDRVSYTGDLRAMVWLRGACLGHLAGMPTSLQEDEQLLGELRRQQQQQLEEGKQEGKQEAGTQLSSSACFELAVQWRACQKRCVMGQGRNSVSGLQGSSTLFGKMSIRQYTRDDRGVGGGGRHQNIHYSIAHRICVKSPV
jgi:hypothetical protein